MRLNDSTMILLGLNTAFSMSELVISCHMCSDLSPLYRTRLLGYVILLDTVI